jgi:hypothetical protein
MSKLQLDALIVIVFMALWTIATEIELRPPTRPLSIPARVGFYLISLLCLSSAVWLGAHGI